MTATTQQMLALSVANEKRRGVAAFKVEVAGLRPREAADVVAEAILKDYEDRIIGTARIRPLLLSVPGLGNVKVMRCLKLAGVEYPDKRLRDLTARQRTAVALQLRIWAKTRSA